MFLRDLKEILYSRIEEIQTAIVWNVATCKVEADGCSIEYAIDRYGDWEVERIGAFENSVVLNVRW